MFSLTVAEDPIKVILLVISAFFWLLSFLSAAVVWALLSKVCDYLIIGAYLAVLSQEIFRYLLHLFTKRAKIYLAKVLYPESTNGNRDEIRIEGEEFQDNLHLSYVSGLGFGMMSCAFSLMNSLTDSIGPGTIGLKGDSHYFMLVSSLIAIAFTLLNVFWSILMAESVDKSDSKLAAFVVGTHFIATTITFMNRIHLQIITITVIYALTFLCGNASLQRCRSRLRAT